MQYFWRLKKRAVPIAVAVAIVVVAAYEAAVFKPSVKADQALTTDHLVRVSSTSHWWLLEPSKREKRSPGIIFYPGFLAETASYSPWARDLAAAGYPVYLVKMPLHLSPLAPNRAAEILDRHADEKFVIGGHSLGGAVAANFASRHSSRLTGIFLMASFVDREAGKKIGKLPVLQIAASKDGIVPLSRSHAEHKELPDETKYVHIRGGNHQQFASFAERWQDYPATIHEEEQLRQVATIISNWLGEVGRMKE